MPALSIENGTRLQIAVLENPEDSPEFDLAATYKESIDNSAFLISVPVRGTVPVTVDETTKIMLRYGMGSETMLISAYCDDVMKIGIRHYWKLRKISEQRQFRQRTDERYKVALKVKYMQETWPLNYEGKIDKDDGLTLDISAGGAAIYMYHRFEIGEICEVTLPRIGTNDEGAEIENVVCSICWYKDAPKGSMYKNICGVQFRFSGDEDRNRVKQYVENIKTVYKL